MQISDIFSILLMIGVFVLSLVIILVIPKIRAIENGTLKTIIYILLGIVAFTLVGFAFNLWEPAMPPDKLIASAIVNPYIQFYPMMILSLALSATVLISYMEKDNYAYFFAGAGFGVLIPDLLTYVFGNGRFDLALLGCALWAVIPLTWAYMWRGNAMVETTAWEKVLTSLKAAILTYPVYLLTAIIAVFGESSRGLDAGAFSGIAKSLPDIVGFIMVTLWLFFLFSIIIISLMFVIHDLALHLFNIKREATTTGIRYERIRAATAKTIVPARPKVNHYKTLIDEMQIFSRYMDNVDRLRAASTIGRFKNEYQTLAVKYNEDSKVEAEKMIKVIEQEFMKKYSGGS